MSVRSAPPCSRQSFVMRLLATMVILLATDQAYAQFGGPGMMPPAAPPQQQKAAPKKDPNAPETHAASGSDNEAIPKPTTTEPTLPANPLEVSPAVRERIGSTADTDVTRVEAARSSAQHFFRLIPPYFEEQSGGYRFRTVFPLWLERQVPGDRASHYGLLYHQRRSTNLNADVLFPLFWRWDEGKDKTTIVGPAGWHRSPTANDTFFAPLFFQGKRPDGGYLTIPPLLTFLKTDKYGGHNIVGPGYCFWRGGQTCNPETADEIHYGVMPFYLAGKTDRSRFEFVPPLLHYYNYTELDQSWINVWGPVILAHYPDKDAFHVAPLFFHTWGSNEDHITIPPLMFHYGYHGNASLLVTPAFLWARGDHNEHTFVTWGYARYRGRTQLDMITPLYWRYEDPDAHYEQKLLLPFLYSAQGPRESSVAFFPFYGHFRRFGLSESTWITPLFQHTTSITGWETNLHPLLYLGRDRQQSHTVVAPFFWDFATPISRTTVGFPIYWRFADEGSVSQLLLNTYYHEKKLRNGLDWELHLFPLFSYGETPNGHWWNLLYGLAGYTRRGAEAQMRLFWVPIQLSQDILH